jgi:hypothetical protein
LSLWMWAEAYEHDERDQARTSAAHAVTRHYWIPVLCGACNWRVCAKRRFEARSCPQTGTCTVVTIGFQIRKFKFKLKFKFNFPYK